MGRTTGQTQLTKRSFVELAILNPGATSQWGKKLLKFLKSLVKTKYHRETGQRWRPYKLSVPWGKAIHTTYQPPLYRSLTCAKNSNIAPLITDLYRSLTSGIADATSDGWGGESLSNPSSDCCAYNGKGSTGFKMLTCGELSLRSYAAFTSIICHWLEESQLVTAEESN